jgi:hypothetical protein
LILLGVYALALTRTFQALRKGKLRDSGTIVIGKVEQNSDEFDSVVLGRWIDRGIVLGALGGLAGFFVSGLVHYNWGDSEVVMIFYFIMGLSLVVERNSKVDTATSKPHRLISR